MPVRRLQWIKFGKTERNLQIKQIHLKKGSVFFNTLNSPFTKGEFIDFKKNIVILKP